MFPSHLMARDLTRSSLPGSARHVVPDTQLTIRFAAPADAPAIERLAALDSARVPDGELVLAEVDGEVVALVPLTAGRPVADPFRHTAEIVRLLELRASQLRRELEVARKAGRRAAVPRPLRALAR